MGESGFLINGRRRGRAMATPKRLGTVRYGLEVVGNLRFDP